MRLFFVPVFTPVLWFCMKIIKNFLSFWIMMACYLFLHAGKMVINSVWGQVFGDYSIDWSHRSVNFKCSLNLHVEIVPGTFLTGFSTGKSGYWNDENGCQKGTPFVWIIHPTVFKIGCFLFFRSVVHISDVHIIY